MAIGTPTHIGAAFAATATAAQTISAVTASAGDLIFVATTDDGAGSTYAASDSAGNTYTPLGTAQALASNYNLWCFYSVLTSPLAAGTVTVTKSGGTGGTWDRHITVEKVTGTGLTLDQIAQATGSGTAWSSGNTPTTTAAAEVVFGAAAGSGAPTGSTPGGSSTELYDNNPANASNFIDITTTYKIVAATGAQSAIGTWAVTDSWAASAFTFKEGGAAPAVLLPRSRRQSVRSSRRGSAVFA